MRLLWLSLLVFAAFLLADPLYVSGTHISGGNITYQCLGSDQFLINLDLFRDGSGIPMDPTQDITVTSSCGDLGTVTLNLANPGGTNISQLCSADSLNGTCFGGPLPCMELYTYQAVITLPFDCNDWTFSWNSCCRNDDVINIPNPGGVGTTLNTVVNTVIDSCNTSPIFTAQPIQYICTQTPITYNFGVTESDGDSLYFQLVNAIDDNGVPVTYVPPLSATNPIDGITIDPFTGELQFTVQQQGNYVVAILVEEYDENDNLIGTILRDIQFVVLPGPCNSPDGNAPINNLGGISGTGSPVLTSPYSIEMCDGGSFSFQISVFDPDAADIITLTSNIVGNPDFPGATFSQVSGNPATAVIDWSAPGGNSFFNSFTVTASDNSCPIENLTTYTYTVSVLTSTVILPHSNYCLGGDLAELNVIGGNSYVWTDISGGSPIDLSCDTCSTTYSTPSVDSVTYVVTSDLVSQAGCAASDTTTVHLVPVYTNISTNDTLLQCSLSGVDLDVSHNAGSNASYVWSPGSMVSDSLIQNPIGFPNDTMYFYVQVTSDTGCQRTDSVLVIPANPVQLYLIADDTGLCIGDTTQLTALLSGIALQDDFDNGVSPDWGLISGASSLNMCNTPTGNELYFNGTGLRFAQTADMDVSSGGVINFGLIFGNSTGICETPDTGEDVSLEASTNGGGTWQNIATYNHLLYTTYTTFTVQIPAFAQTSSTRFRWVQAVHDEPVSDNWALDNVSVIAVQPNTNYTYNWSPSAGLSSPTINNPLASPVQTTNYTVSVTDPITGCLHVDSVLIRAGQPFNISTSPDPDTVMCDFVQGVQLQVSHNAVVNVTYNWSPGNIFSDSTIFNPTAHPGQTTMTYVTVLADDGCDRTDSIEVQVFDQRTLIVTPDTGLCLGDAAQLNADIYIVDTCFYTLEMFDTFGDGWNGAFLTVLVNGASIGTFSVSALNGTNETQQFPVMNGEYFELEFTSGVFDDEVIFNLLDPSGNNIFTDGPFPTVGISYGTTSSCNPPVNHSYLWTPSATLSQNNISNPLASPLTTTTYTVVSTDLNSGCVYIDSVKVFVSPDFSITVNPDSMFICSPDSVQLNVTESAPGNYTYNWSPNNVLNDSAVFNPMAFVDSTTFFIVTVTSDSGCHKVDIAEIVVNQPNNVQIVGDTGMCVGDTVQLSIDLDTATCVYTLMMFDSWPDGWNGGFIAMHVNGLPSDTFFAPNPVAVEVVQFSLNPGDFFEFEYTPGFFENENSYQLYDPNGNLIFQDGPTPGIGLVFSSTATCSGSQSYLFNWTPSADLNDPTISDPLAFPTSSTNYIATVTEQNSGCVYTDTFLLRVGQDFNITVSPLVLDICESQPVQLNVTEDVADTYTYQWSPAGFLSSTTIPNPVSNVFSSVSYEVEVTNSDGCSQSDSVHITLHPSINWTLNSGQTGLCVGESTQLDVNVSGSNGVTDDFDPGIDGSAWSLINGGASSLSCGSMSGNALYFNGGGVIRSAETVDMNTIGGGNIQFGLLIGSGFAPCEDADIGEDVVLEYSNNGGGVWINIATYDEALFPAYTVINQPIPVAAQTAATRFRWRQLAFSGNGFDNWSIDDVDVSLTSPSNFTYLWSPAAGLDDPAIANPVASPVVTTNYVVAISDNNTGCTYLDSVLISVGGQFTLTTTPDTIMCSTSGVGIEVFPSIAGSYTYNWTPSSGLSNPFVADPLASPSSTTYYYVDVENSGCSKLDSILVTVTNPINLSISSSANAICETDSVLLSAGGGQANLNYSWAPSSSLANPLDSNTMAGPVTNTMFYVTATQQVGTCFAVDSIQINVGPLFYIEASPDTQFCGTSNLSVFVLDSAGPGSIYQWSPSGLFTNSTNASTQMSPLTDTTVYIQVTSSQGCVLTDSIIVDYGFPISLNAIPTDTILCEGASFTAKAIIAAPNSSFSNNNSLLLTDNGTSNSNITVSGMSPLIFDQSIMASVCLDIDHNEVSDLEIWLICPNGNSIALSQNIGSGADYDGTCFDVVSGSITLGSPPFNGSFSPQDPFSNLNGCPSNGTWTLMVIDEVTGTQGVLNNWSITFNPVPGTFSYNWTPSGLFNDPTIDSPVVSGFNSDTVVYITVSESGSGCTALDSITIDIVDSLQTSLLFSDTITCVPVGLQLGISHNGPAGTTVNWSPGNILNDSLLLNPTLTASFTGTFYVIISDPSGCFTQMDSVVVTAIPPSVITTGPDTVLCFGDSVPVHVSGGTSWSWSPDTLAVTPNDSMTLVFPDSTMYFSVDAFNSSGCVVTDSVLVTVFYMNQNIDLGADHMICPQGFDTLVPVGTFDTYLWSDGSTGNFLTVDTLGDYWVIGYNPCGSDTDTVSISGFFPSLPITFSSDTHLLCIGDSTQIIPTTTGTNPSWFPNTFINDSSLMSPIVFPSSDVFYNLEVEDVNGCKSVDSVFIDVRVVQNVDIISDTSICNGDSVQLFVTGGTGFSWSPSLNLSSDTISNPFSSVTSQTNYLVNVVDSQGCDTVLNVSVEVNALPFVNAGQDLWLCSGDSIQLNVTGALSYIWNPNSSLLNALSPNPIAFPVDTQEYIVEGVDLNGCSNMDTLIIYVDVVVPLDAGIDTSLCPGDTLDIGVSGGAPDGTTFLWTPSLGLENDTLELTRAFPAITTVYYLNVINGSCSGIDSVVIAVDSNLIVDLGPDTSVCGGGALILNAQNSGSTYLWSTTEISQTINVTTAGVYFVDVTSPSGCLGVDTITINMSLNPVPVLIPDTSVCAGDSIILFTNETGLHNWSTLENTDSITIFSGGIYSVVVTNNLGCTGFDTVIITNAIPVPLDLGPDVGACLGQNIQVAVGFVGYTYDWSNGATTNAITVNSQDMYILNISDPSGNECPAVDSIMVYFYTPPTFIPALTDTFYCSPDSLMVTIQTDSLNTIAWVNSTGVLISDSLSAVFSSQNEGIFYLTVSDTSTGCVVKDTLQVTQSSGLDLTISGDSVICNDVNSLIFASTTGNSANVIWNDGSTGDQFVINQSSVVSASISNECGSISDTLNVIGEDCELTIPNVFTPNGDGQNDWLEIKGIPDGEEWTLSIFNRWGEMVFFTERPSGDFWNGKAFSGEEFPEGVYYYVLQPINNGEGIHGFIQLIR